MTREMEVFVENLKPYIDFDCSEGSLMTRVCCEEMEVFVENLKPYVDLHRSIVYEFFKEE
ncbi:hypothetical protein J6590_028487 [Homalodisca vitripennis]|nr:hypothetical protein J6590_028487 [Homalodisca vitripennis]